MTKFIGSSIIILIGCLVYCSSLAAAPSITATPSSAAPGDTVSVTVSGSDGGKHDWVGLFAVGASNSSDPIAWEYLSGTQNLPPSGLTSATLTFVLPSNLPAGQYVFNLEFDNGVNAYMLGASSNPITVTSGSGSATVAATPSSVAPGGTVTVTVSGSDGGKHDWVGLFAIGASNSSDPIAWEYLSGTQSLPPSGLTDATLTFVLPSNLAPAQYVFNLEFDNGVDSYVLGASSNSITVTSEGGSATIVANLGNSGATIPSNFVGFSDEVPDVIADSIFTPGNTSLINLLQLLGPNGVFRIGGGSSDSSPPPALTQQIASDTAAFISAVGPGWKTIYGLDAVIQDSSIAVTQAGYLLNTFPLANVAFQIGNEPDLFTDEAGWISIFNNYYSALTPTYAGINFGGPDTSSLSNISWIDGTVLGANGFEYVTGHKYTLPCNCFPSCNPPPPPAQVIADATVPANPGVTITEFGIICDGGMDGVTNVLEAATYYLRLAQSAFSGGYSGIDPHNVIIPELWGDGLTRPAYYNQFIQEPDGGYGPAPMFYGMYLFAQLEGQTSIGTTVDPSLNNLASVNATIGPQGNANILVINISTDQQITVTPDQTRTWSTANVYLLSGQSCTDPNPVLNGVPIGEGGAWSGNPISLANGASISIPACGAALIKIQP